MGQAEGHGVLSDATGRLAALADAARSALSRAIGDQRGTTAIEYAVVASMISIVIVTAATTIGQQVKYFFTEMLAPFL
jgi:Flp pilus assembly pilin Flp